MPREAGIRVKKYRPKYRYKGERRESAVWWVDYRHNGRRVRESLETRSARAAEIKVGEIRRQLERQEIAQAMGVESHQETIDARPQDLIEEYVTELERLGRVPEHYETVRARLGALLEDLDSIREVSPRVIRNRLRVLATERHLSGRTQNFYRTALHGLFEWLIGEERWEHNPVKAVKRVKVNGPTRRPRRALTTDELRRLIAAVPHKARPEEELNHFEKHEQKLFRERALVYLVAATTGLRRSELRALRRGDIDLEQGTVTIRADKAKNRKEDVLPLHPEVRAALRKRFGDNTRTEAPALPPPPDVRTLYKDLERAGIERVTPSGKIDFHALRTTFATMLARQGVTLQQAQRLLRHSTPELTSNLYTRLELNDGRGAVEALPVDDFLTDSPPADAQA